MKNQKRGDAVIFRAHNKCSHEAIKGHQGREKLNFLIMLHYSYFNKGMAVTQSFRYLLYLFGMSSRNIIEVMTLGGIYGIMAYFVGMAFYKGGFVEAEQEVSNRFNKFVRDVREKLK